LSSSQSCLPSSQVPTCSSARRTHCPRAGYPLSSSQVPPVLKLRTTCPQARDHLSSSQGPLVLKPGTPCPQAKDHLSSSQGPLVLKPGTTCPQARDCLSSSQGPLVLKPGTTCPWIVRQSGTICPRDRYPGYNGNSKLLKPHESQVIFS
jgi:hypothetical protein